MSVAEQLGLDDPGSNELMQQARRLWPEWSRSDPRLAVVSDPLDVPRWTLAADRAQADDVLHALATLAGRDSTTGTRTSGGTGTGSDTDVVPVPGARPTTTAGRPAMVLVDEEGDLAAAMTLCWTLLPAAASLSRDLSRMSPSMDEIVASQLWVEARSFPWRRLRKVAANIRANTRAGVLNHFLDRARVNVQDGRAWNHTWFYDPAEPFWDELVDPCASAEPVPEEPTAPEELTAVLEWACRRGVITEGERSLLLSLVRASEGIKVTRSRRGGGGLMANELSEHVARGLGVSPVTVRRRARRSMLALAEACRHGRYDACA